jgi:acyl carrier protein phosphodiesterase
MNWLAHIFLSEDDAEYRIGNVIADWVKGEARRELSPGIQRGIACHTQIDLFTDMHAIVLHSQSLIQPPYRRFAGVLVDVFYDHFLAIDWDRYCDTPLSIWIQQVYAQFNTYAGHLHPQVRLGLQHMGSDDWLGSYFTVDGIAVILKRMANRLSRPTVLGDSACELTANYDALRADFHTYFLQLQMFVRDWQTRQITT